MAQFDRFAQSIFKFKADLLVIASGERVVLGFGPDKKPVSAEPATRQQVEGIVKEIAPPHLAPQLAREGEHAFVYRAPAGPVQIHFVRKDASVRLTAAPSASEPATPETAAIPVAAETTADPFVETSREAEASPASPGEEDVDADPGISGEPDAEGLSGDAGREASASPTAPGEEVSPRALEA